MSVTRAERVQCGLTGNLVVAGTAEEWGRYMAQCARMPKK
eukprot:CAMPEP_0203947804 /NCGR_PEP_ID=MMETSP0359-20131031/82654_1 /ASSEMBLY_ACC=CAM_ASM_000338 /TAXON_ID=268821 /ORGANISM="Scrippsiella Hangoei, Strain SHTV-5" /LENGTH=39 /DNA_ID= /DNA_START= /DNA_END= /DNA_ORIENTATION=